jgi:hypothetical protein
MDMSILGVLALTGMIAGNSAHPWMQSSTGRAKRRSPERR